MRPSISIQGCVGPSFQLSVLNVFLKSAKTRLIFTNGNGQEGFLDAPEHIFMRDSPSVPPSVSDAFFHLIVIQNFAYFYADFSQQSLLHPGRESRLTRTSFQPMQVFGYALGPAFWFASEPVLSLQPEDVWLFAVHSHRCIFQSHKHCTLSDFVPWKERKVG